MLSHLFSLQRAGDGIFEDAEHGDRFFVPVDRLLHGIEPDESDEALAPDHRQGHQRLNVLGFQYFLHCGCCLGKICDGRNDDGLSVLDLLHPPRNARAWNVLEIVLLRRDAPCTPLVGIALGDLVEPLLHRIAVKQEHVAPVRPHEGPDRAQRLLDGPVEAMDWGIDKSGGDLDDQMLELGSPAERVSGLVPVRHVPHDRERSVLLLVLHRHGLGLNDPLLPVTSRDPVLLRRCGLPLFRGPKSLLHLLVGLGGHQIKHRAAVQRLRAGGAEKGRRLPIRVRHLPLDRNHDCLLKILHEVLPLAPPFAEVPLY